jgi:hypothetical protein
MLYHKEILSLPTTPFREDFVFPNIGIDKDSSYIEVPCHNLNQQVMTFFEQRGLEPVSVIVFRKKQNTGSVLHTDVFYENNTWVPWHCGLNWNLYNAKYVMEWYNTKDTTIVYPQKTETNTNICGINYGHMGNKDTSNYELLHSDSSSSIALVRIGIPHVVKNLDEIDRWGVSIRFKGNPTFEDCSLLLD